MSRMAMMIMLVVGLVALMGGCLENNTVTTIAQLNDAAHKYDDQVTLRVWGTLSASLYEKVTVGIGEPITYDLTITKGDKQVNEGAQAPEVAASQPANE